jgi:hypothetical protein
MLKGGSPPGQIASPDFLEPKQGSSSFESYQMSSLSRNLLHLRYTLGIGAYTYSLCLDEEPIGTFNELS